jgi:hypothetical protein
MGASSKGARSRVYEGLRKLIESRPQSKAVWQFLHTWTSDPGDDRANGLLTAAMLENELEETILIFFDGRDDKFFKDQENGSVLTFNMKIRLAYALGIIEDNAKHDLKVIKDIRNTFAHSSDSIVFETDAIKNACNSLIIPNHLTWGGLMGDSPLGSPKDMFAKTISLLYTYLSSHRTKNRLSGTEDAKLLWNRSEFYCLVFLNGKEQKEALMKFPELWTSLQK